MKPPKYLGTIARRKWKELLAQLGEIKPAEVDSLALLCCSWETYLTALDDVRSTGNVIKSAVNGRMFVNPSVNVMNEAWKQITKLSKAFGLQPSSRSTEPQTDDAAKWNGLIDED